jgi:5-amino-6-(5-phosphoribosylamino)uracil reductase
MSPASLSDRWPDRTPDRPDPHPNSRPTTLLVLALSLDGKIADFQRSPARFGSKLDLRSLEGHIAQADATLFGAATLRAYGTTLRVSDPTLLTQRQRDGRSPQPVQIVCSASGQLDPTAPFFRQPIPRWLLTTPVGADAWGAIAASTLEPAPETAAKPAAEPIAGSNSAPSPPLFDHILVGPTHPDALTDLHWPPIMAELKTLGIHRLVIMGGGHLIASLLRAHLIDEIWLTLCPLILGGDTAPTLAPGPGWLQALAPRLTLLEFSGVNDELFIHYRLNH